ncbi:MAG: GDSL-type esterase/lipase family protein [Luteolibacter sp.]
MQSGQKVAFLGDSITGRLEFSRWLRAVLAVHGPGRGSRSTVTPICRRDSPTRCRPSARTGPLKTIRDWLFLSCGVNDVWHGRNGVPLNGAAKRHHEHRGPSQAQSMNVIILTATPIGEDDNDNNHKLAAYNDFLRELASQRKLPLADLNASFQAVSKPLAPTSSSRILTVDGVHMNPEGNVIMAKGCLRAVGVSIERIKGI